MKTLKTPLAFIAILLAGIAAQPVMAQTAAPAPIPVSGGTIIPGIAFANLNNAVQQSNAWRVAQQQIPVTYKAAFDAANVRRQAADAQLKPLIDKFNADRAKPGANAQLLQPQIQQIQRIDQQGDKDAQAALAPAALADAYVKEQLGDKIEQAVVNAMKKRNVSMLMQPGSFIKAADSYDVTNDVVAELNTIVPSVNIVPPTGWEPREVREQRAAQAAQSGQRAPAAPAPAKAPAGPRPDSR